MALTGTISAEELLLFVVAVYGVIHHLMALVRVLAYRQTVRLPADVILSRIYTRVELARITLKLLFTFGAVYMMTLPAPLIDGWDDLAWLLGWRFGLVAVALVMDVESMLAERDRAELGRLPASRVGP